MYSWLCLLAVVCVYICLLLVVNTDISQEPSTSSSSKKHSVMQQVIQVLCLHVTLLILQQQEPS